MNNNKQALQVAALKDGTVIDHIPSDKLFQVVSLLGIEHMDTNVTIGFNLDSKKLGKKGIIKLADKFFSDEEISRLSVVAPNVKLNIIHDYEVVEKKEVHMPDELRVQIAPIFELIKLKGIPLLQIAGVEADDVLATLAVKGEKAGMDVVIATGDKDLAQMVTDHVTLINTMSRTRSMCLRK